jgi:hypothetical protein
MRFLLIIITFTLFFPILAALNAALWQECRMTHTPLYCLYILGR